MARPLSIGYLVLLLLSLLTFSDEVSAGSPSSGKTICDYVPLFQGECMDRFYPTTARQRRLLKWLRNGPTHDSNVTAIVTSKEQILSDPLNFFASQDDMEGFFQLTGPDDITEKWPVKLNIRSSTWLKADEPNIQITVRHKCGTVSRWWTHEHTQGVFFLVTNGHHLEEWHSQYDKNLRYTIEDTCPLFPVVSIKIPTAVPGALKLARLADQIVTLWVTLKFGHGTGWSLVRQHLTSWGAIPSLLLLCALRHIQKLQRQLKSKTTPKLTCKETVLLNHVKGSFDAEGQDQVSLRAQELEWARRDRPSTMFEKLQERVLHLKRNPQISHQALETLLNTAIISRNKLAAQGNELKVTQDELIITKGRLGAVVGMCLSKDDRHRTLLKYIEYVLTHLPIQGSKSTGHERAIGRKPVRRCASSSPIHQDVEGRRQGLSPVHDAETIRGRRYSRAGPSHAPFDWRLEAFRLSVHNSRDAASDITDSQPSRIPLQRNNEHNNLDSNQPDAQQQNLCILDGGSKHGHSSFDPMQQPPSPPAHADSDPTRNGNPSLHPTPAFHPVPDRGGWPAGGNVQGAAYLAPPSDPTPTTGWPLAGMAYQPQPTFSTWPEPQGHGHANARYIQPTFGNHAGFGNQESGRHPVHGGDSKQVNLGGLHRRFGRYDSDTAVARVQPRIATPPAYRGLMNPGRGQTSIPQPARGVNGTSKPKEPNPAKREYPNPTRWCPDDLRCERDNCPDGHHSPAMPRSHPMESTPGVMEAHCRFGLKCQDASCNYWHLSTWRMKEAKWSLEEFRRFRANWPAQRAQKFRELEAKKGNDGMVHYHG